MALIIGAIVGWVGHAWWTGRRVKMRDPRVPRQGVAFAASAALAALFPVIIYYTGLPVAALYCLALLAFGLWRKRRDTRRGAAVDG